MALIQCPECGQTISDKAGSCPNCGYPLNSAFGNVNIALPAYIEGVKAISSLFSDNSVLISDSKSREQYYSGFLGSIASFQIAEPTEIGIYLGKNVEYISVVVAPNTNYRLVYVGTRYGRALYQLIPV